MLIFVLNIIFYNYLTKAFTLIVVKSSVKKKGVFQMPKRGENIHKRKDGRWEGRYIKDRDFAGRAIYKSVYGKSYLEVKHKLNEIIKNPSLPDLDSYKEYQFKDVLSMWLQANKMNFKGATENKYQHLINTHIVPDLGELKISKMTAKTINSFIESKLQNGRVKNNESLSNSYVRSMMLIINSAIQFAVDEHMCGPLSGKISKPKLEKNEITIFTPLEQKRLEVSCQSNFDCTKLGVLLSLYAGLRIGEVCALKWSDIDLNDRLIHVRSTIARVMSNDSSQKSVFIIDKPKTEASIRDIPISSVLLPYLIEMNRKSNSKYVISNKTEFLNVRTYEYRYKKLLKSAGLPSINYHALRHSFATRCIEKGVDAKSLSEMLGHANVATTLNTYVHSSIELKRAQIEKLSSFSA